MLVDDLWGYLGDMDQKGNIFLHMHPQGLITRVSPPGGSAEEMAENPITIDGDSSDWQDMPALLSDAPDDHQGGGVDISSVHAAVDDENLYVLIQTHQTPTDFVQIDLEVKTAEEQFIISFHPNKNPRGNLGRIKNNQFEPLGDVVGGQSAMADSIEYALPIELLGDISELQINIRPMAGTCCEPPEWYVIDEVSYVQIPQPGQWVKTIIIESQELQTACDSGFGFGPDGNLYLAVSRCTEKSDLYQITPEGKLTWLSEVTQLQALRTDSKGRLIVASQNAVYELSLSDYDLEKISDIPGGDISPGGLAFDDQNNILVSTGSRSINGAVYRINQDGTSEKIADVSKNGLTGIEWMPNSNEIIGGQLRHGGVIAVSMDGVTREVVPGNGMLTPMDIAVSPCGELAVPNDDGGMMVIVGRDSQASWLMDYISFIPPFPHAAFQLDGRLYASEGAPGFPGRVILLEPGEYLPKPVADLNYPSGLAFDADGNLYISSTTEGEIIRMDPGTFSRKIFAEGLDYPQALAFNSNGDLFAVANPSNFLLVPDVNPAPMMGDKILRITQSGEIHPFAEIKNLMDIAFSPSGELFATINGMHMGAESMVVRITPDGQYTEFATGFTSATGLSFDLAGNLYIADEIQNGIIRIGGFPHGVLNGKVTDQAGNPLENARIQVYTDDPILVGQVVYSDDLGLFSLNAAPREYTVEISADGFASYTEEGITVTDNQETSLEIILMK